MRVLMLGWELPPSISGGMGVACDGLLRGICTVGGASIQFVIPTVSPAPAAYPPAIRLVELADYEESLRTSLLSHTTSAGYIEKADRYSAAVLRALDRIDDFDLVHAHDWLTFGAALEIKRVTGKPLVAHIHSTERDRSPHHPANPIIVALERCGMDAADCVVAVSQYTKGCLIRDYGQSARRVKVIYNAGTDRAAARTGALPAESGYITFVGRITGQKGPEAFVKAALEIRNAVPSARFVMAGDGDLLPMIRLLVEKLGMTEAFSFPGFIDREEIAQLLAQSRVLVMPSLSEPFGLAALEAIHACVPVVLSKNCGLTERVPSAICVDPEEVQAIAAAAIDILQNPVPARARAQAVSCEAAHLDWAVSAKQLLGVYRTVLTHRR